MNKDLLDMDYIYENVSPPSELNEATSKIN